MGVKTAAATLVLALLSILAFAGAALGTHARPGSATPLRVPLVPAYTECTSAAANSTHVTPIGIGSCTPQALASDLLTLGTGGVGGGSLKLSVFCTDSSTPPCNATDGVNEEDVALDFFQSDVRCRKAAAPAGCSATGADYIGRLVAASSIRITDHSNGGSACSDGTGSACVAGTVEDVTFAVPTASGACVPVAGSPGSTCSFTTTLDSAVPFFGGAVKELQRAVISVFGLYVTDTGEDGDAGAGCPPVCGTGDETRFLDQGLFLP